MREIKFRAWDKIDKKMRIVTRITFGLEPTGHPPIIVHLDDGKDPVTRSIDDVILLQFTGLLDKNGIEIYEGGVIEYYGPQLSKFKKKIKFLDEFTWCGWNIAQSYVQDGQCKVIGNIHENPDLIEEEE